MKLNLLLMLSFLILFGCKEKPEDTIILPTNLAMQLGIDDDNPAKVNVTATADDENFYTIIFNDGDNSESIESNDGKASHIYSESGLYMITVRAHALAANYVELSDTITVFIEKTVDEDGIPTEGYTSPLSYDNYTMVWSDEFSGSSLNESDWNYELGTGSSGWGNNELQYYQKENTTVNNGYLTIEAKKQAAGSSSYTSSRLTTQGKKNFKYGRIDIRAAMPAGQGLWPALWMLGESHSSEGWPDCGEIDIMEMVGGTASGKSDKKTHGTLHWDNFGEYASYGGSTSTSKTNLKEEFHVYTIIWDSESIQWLLDDRKFHEIAITEGHMAEFHEDFFFIFNVAVGGNWPGSPDASTTFPQKMHVDYVRVFQK